MGEEEGEALRCSPVRSGRASDPAQPALPRHPPRSATPPGECGRARLARERATRPPRALRSRTRARRQPRVTCAWPWQQQQRAPWQQPAPPRPRRGCGEGARPSRGARSALRLPPGRLRPRAPLSPPSCVSLRPVLLAAAAGCGCCCCWRPPRPAGGNLWPSRTIFAVSHPLVTPGWGRGHSLGQSGRSWVHGHHLPHLPTCPPPPPTLPPPTFWANRYAAVERVAPDVRALLCENYA